MTNPETIIRCGDHRYHQTSTRSWTCTRCQVTIDPAAPLTLCLCRHHGEELDDDGKCTECYWQDAAQREEDAHQQHAWNTR